MLASVLWFLAYVTFTRAVMQVAGRTQAVTNDAEFVAALGNPAIDTIQLLDDIYLKDKSGAWSPYQPVLQTTNLTVSGCPSNTSLCSEQAWKVLVSAYMQDTGLQCWIAGVLAVTSRRGINVAVLRRGHAYYSQMQPLQQLR